MRRRWSITILLAVVCGMLILCAGCSDTSTGPVVPEETEETGMATPDVTETLTPETTPSEEADETLAEPTATTESPTPGVTLPDEDEPEENETAEPTATTESPTPGVTLPDEDEPEENETGEPEPAMTLQNTGETVRTT
jgi:hypothetical protein